MKNLSPNVDWHVYYFDPATGRKFDQGTIKARAKVDDKSAQPAGFQKNVPCPQDWVLVSVNHRSSGDICCDRIRVSFTSL